MQKITDVDPHLRASFVDAMSKVVTSVSVVTTAGSAGQFGATVSAVVSVSADPPLVSVCVNRSSPLVSAIRQNQVFCVNVLTTEQAEVSDTFAGKPKMGRAFDFACATWRKATTESPVLEGALAVFDCRVASELDAGTHTIFVGNVIRTEHAEADALIHSRRQYGRATLIVQP